MWGRLTVVYDIYTPPGSGIWHIYTAQCIYCHIHCPVYMCHVTLIRPRPPEPHAHGFVYPCWLSSSFHSSAEMSPVFLIFHGFGRFKGLDICFWRWGFHFCHQNKWNVNRNCRRRRNTQRTNEKVNKNWIRAIVRRAYFVFYGNISWQFTCFDGRNGILIVKNIYLDF